MKIKNLLASAILGLGLTQACDCGDARTINRNSPTSYCDTLNNDTISPKVSLLNPDDKTEFNDMNVVNLEYSGQDNSPKQIECDLYADLSEDFDFVARQELNIDSLCNPTNNTFTLVGLPSGTYHWNVRCKDEAGNIGQAENNREFIVNNRCNFGGPNSSPLLDLKIAPSVVLTDEDVLISPNVREGNAPYLCSVDFGDSNTTPYEAVKSRLHKYNSTGNYDIIVSCKDCDGDSVSQTKTIKVIACIDDVIESCGISGSGVKFRKCNDGILGDWSDCTDCETPLRILPCGINGRGKIEQTCIDGQYTEGQCLDSDVCKDGSYDLETGCNINHRGEKHRQCANGQWNPWTDCNPIDECIDNLTEDDCCGYEGSGIKTKHCDNNGRWDSFGNCNISNEVNVSNQHTASDEKSAIGGDNVVFVSNRNGTNRIYSVNSRLSINLAHEISNNLPSPPSTSRGCDSLSDCDWYLYNCSNRPDIEGNSFNNVVFECEWADEDMAVDDWFGGFIYLTDSNNHNITRFVASGFNPKISGNKIVYTEYGTGNVVIYDINSIFGTATNIKTDRGTNPDISGNNVVFSSSKDNLSSPRIYYADITPPIYNNLITSRLISGINSRGDDYPSIDGNLVAWETGKEVEHSRQICYCTLPNCNPNCNVSNPGEDSFSPRVSGDKIVYTANVNGNNKDIKLYDTSTRTNISLINNSSQDFDASIDGCKISYTSDRTGDNEIFVYDLCEGSCRQ